MEIQGTEDLRVQKTIAAIRAAFDDMIDEMDYTQMTVTELCRRAKINKKTFYRYYPTLDDLLVEVRASYVRSFVDNVRDFAMPEDLDDNIREFWTYSARQRPVYERLTCSGSYDDIRDAMVEEVRSSADVEHIAFPNVDGAERDLLLFYVSTTAVELYKHWIASGKAMPVDRMIEIHQALVCGGVRALLTT